MKSVHFKTIDPNHSITEMATSRLRNNSSINLIPSLSGSVIKAKINLPPQTKRNLIKAALKQTYS
jgi:hypothetical protein